MFESVAARHRRTRQATLAACAHWLASSAAVWLAVAFASQFVPFCDEHPKASRRDVADCMAAWDGQWYAQIAADGYFYDPGGESSVAFFPAFPMLGRALAAVASLRTESALLLVSNAAWLAALVLANSYVRQGETPAGGSYAGAVVAAMAWFPTTFYFHMAYSESLFLLLTVAALYGMRRQWPAWRLALVVGLATATRPVGVALVAPLGLHLWRRARDRPKALALIAPTLLFACWGLLSYIGYQARVFGEPLAFAKAQASWSVTIHRNYGWERALRLLTFEPIRAVYDPATSFYWGLRAPRETALFNMMFANPIYFLLTVATIAFGRIKRWLTIDETLLGALLLLIPYVPQADRTCMASQARFAAAVFPAYLVWGRMLNRLPELLGGATLALSGVLMAVYSALFASWYWYY